MSTVPFDQRYHASRNRGACDRDIHQPCAICGWAEHMAIHYGSQVPGYSHAYRPERPVRFKTYKQAGVPGHE